MPRQQRANSTASNGSAGGSREQELGSMYDYLAKVILLGPSGCGKSCLLHRFVKNEWRVLSSQTIGVEFASRIVKVGTGARRKRIKLQLWDTAGTERFRAVSRSYYRGAAGAILVYDIANHASFAALPTFLSDARALASPQLTLLLAGNKVDVEDGSPPNLGPSNDPSFPASFDSRKSYVPPSSHGSISSTRGLGLGSQNKATIAPEGREVSSVEASRWASAQGIPVSVEVSALSGENVEEIFTRLARTILTRIELGEINPDDPQSGIQYGDSGGWGDGDGASVKSGMTVEDGGPRRRRGGKSRRGKGGGLRDWEEVFRLDGRRRNGCC
ncbi:GTP-binding protein ypt4 [Aulographum hederae CBS 113979]|uniref:GTP-binding protein ypt4 n=1 Tax=Aulographum hederae CBS 113979 TaxID=1176131 RepID=A0A6G1GXI3_9PEZI|nr:GTP-binding protein ypt4 [Aulographum hederae CBS 113979]